MNAYNTRRQSFPAVLAAASLGFGPIELFNMAGDRARGAQGSAALARVPGAMAATTNFVAAQAANRRNTLLLLVVLTALAALFGYLIGWCWRATSTDTVAVVSHTGLAAAAILSATSIIWSGISLAFGSRMVLAMADAKPIEKGRGTAALQTWSRRCRSQLACRCPRSW